MDNFQVVQGESQNQFSPEIGEQVNEPEVSLFWKQITLNQGITQQNYIGSLIHYFSMTFIFVSVQSLQPMLFKRTFDINSLHAGEQNAQVLAVDIATKLIFAPIFGIFNDQYGRKKTLICGISFVTVSLLLMSSITEDQPLSVYYIYRIIYAIGAISIATSPLLADYVHTTTKGRGSAIIVVMASFGAMASAYLISNLLKSKISISTCYIIIACGFPLVGLSYVHLLKAGLYFQTQKEIQGEIMQRNCQNLMQVGIEASKDVWILMGYVCNFIGRADSILLTLFLVLWAYQKVPNIEGSSEQEQIQSFDKANTESQILSGVAYTFIMIFSIIYGVLFERGNKFLILTFIFLCTALGCFMLAWAEKPMEFYTFLTMAVLGTGMSGLYTAALYLINNYAQQNHRGFITGLANIFSVSGIFVCAVGGGFLIDYWSDVAPFLIFGFFSLLSCVLLFFAYKRHLNVIGSSQLTEEGNVYIKSED